MRLPLQGKLAIVTGGGRGIGAAVARALAQRGCRVLITYRSNVDAAADTCSRLPGDGHDARQCDVTDADAVAALRGPRRGVDIVLIMPRYTKSLISSTARSRTGNEYGETRSMRTWSGPADHLPRGRMAARRRRYRVCEQSRGLRGEPTAPAYGAEQSGPRPVGAVRAKLWLRRTSSWRRGAGICGHGDGCQAAPAERGARSAATARSTGSRASTRSPSATFLSCNAKWSSGAII